MMRKIRSAAARLVKSNWKYPLAVLCFGIFLLILPTGNGQKEEIPVENPILPRLDVDPAEMESILSQVRGAGKVRVLLSMETGQATDYAQNTELQTQRDESGSSSKESHSHVITSAGSGTQVPLERVTSAPKYRGAVIVCQGADDPTVRLALTQAVASLTGLGTNQIVIMKMN